jgi:hypothetical protein
VSSHVRPLASLSPSLAQEWMVVLHERARRQKNHAAAGMHGGAGWHAWGAAAAGSGLGGTAKGRQA